MDNSRAASRVSDVIEQRPLGEQLSVKTIWQDFLALIKVGIVNSNLITTFTGLWLALHFTEQSFVSNIATVIMTLIGAALVIAGGATFNNYIDRDIDPLMERTKERPTVTGKVGVRKVLWLASILSFTGTLVLTAVQPMAGILGLAGLFLYVVVYTMWTKRKYTLNTVIGSFSGAVPPLIGWAAIDPGLHPVAWVLFLIMFLWQPPHFLALAMRRVEEYRKAGIPMLPVIHGFAMTKRQIVVYIACLLPIPFYLFSLGAVYMVIAGLLGFGWLLLGIKGFFMKDDVKWATMMFVYSLNYLTILFVTMIVVTMF